MIGRLEGAHAGEGDEEKTAIGSDKDSDKHVCPKHAVVLKFERAFAACSLSSAHAWQT
jgi:hypothetical protein